MLRAPNRAVLFCAWMKFGANVVASLPAVIVAVPEPEIV